MKIGEAHPCLVAVDEANLFTPQGGAQGALRHARKASGDAVTDLMSRGRKRGLCGVLATQRLVKLAKSVAAEAIGWTLRRAQDSLPGLDASAFVAVGPAFTRSPSLVRVGPVQTRHRGSTPRLGEAPTRRADGAGLIEIEDLAAASDTRALAARSGVNPRDVNAVRRFAREPGFLAAARVMEMLRGHLRDLRGQHYRPKVHPDAVRVVHAKTRAEAWFPLLDEARDGADRLIGAKQLYPVLQARLDGLKAERIGGLMLVRDWVDRAAERPLPWPTGKGDLSFLRHEVKDLIRAAGLREELTFQSVRHGGMTEGGDAESPDRELLAQSRHTTPKVLPLYAKETMRQVAFGARKRLASRTKAAGLSE